jgi:hypothetical protein
MKNKKVKNDLKEPTGRDDFFVWTMRREDKNYMSHDPRFSEKAMNERMARGLAKTKKQFEERQGLA